MDVMTLRSDIMKINSARVMLQSVFFHRFSGAFVPVSKSSKARFTNLLKSFTEFSSEIDTSIPHFYLSGACGDLSVQKPSSLQGF